MKKIRETMVRKKIDNRIRVMIENGINLGHRTMFAIVGDKAKGHSECHQPISKMYPAHTLIFFLVRFCVKRKCPGSMGV